MDDSSFINKGKVNFQRKGSINFSYSFLPEDVLTKKVQKRIQDAMRTLDDIMGSEKAPNLDLKDNFIKEVIAKSVNFNNNN